MRKLRVESNELLHHLSPSKQANGVKISIGSTYWRCRVELTFHGISIDCRRRRRVLCGCLMLLLLLYLVRARTHTNTQRHKCSTVRVWTQKGNGGRWVGGWGYSCYAQSDAFDTHVTTTTTAETLPSAFIVLAHCGLNLDVYYALLAHLDAGNR